MSDPQILAVDLGASSGRVIAGRIEKGRLELRHIARFANDPVRLRDGLHWDLLHLYAQVKSGISLAVQAGPVMSAGIDSWAVDYALLRDGALLGMPYHYRDSRTVRGVDAVHAVIDPHELYQRNGLQHLPFTTVFQLAVDRERGLLKLADQMLLVPDLLTYWLTGTVIAERTNASTTGLVAARTGQWDVELLDRLGMGAGLLANLVDPGVSAGMVTDEVAAEIGQHVEIMTVGSHDTASAVVAVPLADKDAAYISCGTWGLVGLELDEPVLADTARVSGFTNERGVDDRVRFLHNVMGLWVLTETIRTWHPLATPAQRSSVLQQLLAAAADEPSPMAVFDVDDARFLPPGDMPDRISQWYREHDLPVPATKAALVRCILESLATAFADAVSQAAALAGRSVSVIHVVGGGAQNALLCQLVARCSGLPVVAGPVEATAIGNLLVQARAHGLVDGDLEALREVVIATFPLQRYEP